MIRGTTAQFKFKLPYDLVNVPYIKISFWQPYNYSPYLPIVKDRSSCSATNNSKELSVTLTPEETLRFTDERKVCVQLSGLTIEGNEFKCHEQLIPIYSSYEEQPLEPIEPSIPIDPTPFDTIFLDGGIIGGLNNE